MPQCLIFLLESPGLLGAASGAPHANGWCNETEKRVKQLSCEASRQSSSEDGRDFPHLTKILISFLNKLTLCREESQGRHITHRHARAGQEMQLDINNIKWMSKIF